MLYRVGKIYLTRNGRAVRIVERKDQLRGYETVLGVLDRLGEPHARETLFGRYASGEYVAVAYQQAWGGWKLARGEMR